jgi:hypothetical protein
MSNNNNYQSLDVGDNEGEEKRDGRKEGKREKKVKTIVRHPGKGLLAYKSHQD